MATYETEHDGHQIRVRTNGFTGQVVDSGMGYITTLKPEDRERGIVVSTDYSKAVGFKRSVRLLGNGSPQEIPKV